MKKLLLTGLLMVGLAAQASAALIATNLTTVTAGGDKFLLLSDRASVYSVEISVNPSITASALVKLYDQSTVAAPYYGTNYVTAEYVSRSTYATNVASSYIGFNGVTNWYTNTYVYTYNVTNAAATNALSPSAAFVAAPGTYTVYDVDALFTRGIVVHTSTNVSMVINYRSGR